MNFSKEDATSSTCFYKIKKPYFYSSSHSLYFYGFFIYSRLLCGGLCAFEKTSKSGTHLSVLALYEDGKGKKRRLGEKTEEEKEVEEVRELIAPLGPRALCSGLLRRVGVESVFAEASPRLVARGGPSRAAPGRLSQGLDARRQSPGAREGYQLRSRVGGIRDEWGRLCYGGSR